MTDDQEIWEGAKTSVMMIAGLMFSLFLIVTLNAFGFIDGNVNLDPTLFTFIVGAFISAVLLTYVLEES